MSEKMTDYVFVFDTSETPDAKRPAESSRRSMLGVAIAIVAFAALAAAGTALGQTYEGYHSNPWLLSWIPATCCVTNDCCWEVSERDLAPMENDSWQVLATTQVVKRTGWTPDGKFYRCACDLAEGKWVKHQGANTRCVFVPLRSAGL